MTVIVDNDGIESMMMMVMMVHGIKQDRKSIMGWELALPIRMYAWSCLLKKSNIRSLDFVVDRFFMQLFNTNNIEIIRSCQEHFSFKLPSTCFSHTPKIRKLRIVRL